MADQIKNYKCLACTGPLHYEGKTGRLECEYCGSAYSIEEAEKAFEEEQNAASVDTVWESTNNEWTPEGMKSYSCPSCGAELVCEEEMAASSCPYCGNPTIVPGQLSGLLKPDLIIPFKLDNKAAKENLKNHYRGKFFLPESFKNENHIEELKGVYVPFWLYDGQAEGYMTFHATREHVETRGKERITTTEHYRVDRSGRATFEKIPADASTKMPDDLMDSLEPYNYSELTEFSQVYLPGYMADKYDVSAEENAGRALSRAKQTLKNILRNDVHGYATVNETGSNIKVEQGKAHYAMLPAWLLSTKWENKNYMFAMNGQTGKMVGDLPCDSGKYWLTFLCSFLLIDLIVAIVRFAAMNGMAGLTTFGLVGLFGLLPLIVAFIVCSCFKAQLKSVHLANEAGNYIIDSGTKITGRNDIFINKTVRREKISD